MSAAFSVMSLIVSVTALFSSGLQGSSRSAARLVRGNGCTVLYIQTLDDIFVQSYADLFTDKLAAAQSGETLLYRVTDAGFAPMPMEVSAQ